LHKTAQTLPQNDKDAAYLIQKPPKTNSAAQEITFFRRHEKGCNPAGNEDNYKYKENLIAEPTKVDHIG
jgi:hypothetical protein